MEALDADTDDPLNSFNAAALKAIKVNQGLGEGLAFADYGIDKRFRRTGLGIRSSRMQRKATTTLADLQRFRGL